MLLGLIVDIFNSWGIVNEELFNEYFLKREIILYVEYIS